MKWQVCPGNRPSDREEGRFLWHMVNGDSLIVSAFGFYEVGLNAETETATMRCSQHSLRRNGSNILVAALCTNFFLNGGEEMKLAPPGGGPMGVRDPLWSRPIRERPLRAGSETGDLDVAQPDQGVLALDQSPVGRVHGRGEVMPAESSPLFLPREWSGKTRSLF